MQPNHRLMFAQEVERTMYSFSPLWEGIEAREFDLGNAVLITQPGFAFVQRLCFEPGDTDERLDALIERVESQVSGCLWLLGPSAQPLDLAERLMARGFSLALEWQGLALEDLSSEIERNPAVKIEPLSWENAEEYASAMATSKHPDQRDALLANAQRFLHMSPQEAQIVLARLDGIVVGNAVSRIEANGIIYLRNAMTAPAWRQHGVYLALVAHRLATARAVGCTAAVVQAITTTSAPILIKRGFIPVCRIVGLTRQRA